MTLNVPLGLQRFDRSFGQPVLARDDASPDTGERERPPETVRKTAVAAPDEARLVAAFQYTAVTETFQLSLEVTTREGDVITIDLRRSSAAEASALAVAGDRGQGVAVSASRQQESGIRFSVDGDLNREERKSLEKLLHKLDKLADKFVAGDVQGSLKRVAKLGFNDRQLAGFSLQMGYERQVKAVSAYAATATMTGVESSDLTRTGELAAEVRRLPDPGLAFLQDPARDAAELAESMVKLKAAERDVPLADDGIARLKAMVAAVFDQAFARV